MELRQLEHVLAVARHGTFTAAAAALPMAQSALSTSVRNLEAELGVALFERTTRRVELTAAGRVFLPAAGRLVADAGAAREAVAAMAGLSSGRVAIGTLEMLTSVDLPARLAAFRRAHPGIELSVLGLATYPELLERLLAGELDLSFLPLDGAPPVGVSVLAEWRENLVLVAAEDHPLARFDTVRLADLDGATFVDFGASTTLHGAVQRLVAASGIRRRIAGQVSQRSMLLDLVRAGLGVSVVPRPVAERSGLAIVAIVNPVPYWTIVLATRTPRPVNPAAAALAESLLAAG
ncbi:LysR family transcriptional regulator [Pseudonocardia acidicola]|uniref:LysR family transcriptional regulator n=1 Tax=Pseudonocardia acidicola TaxID=2724939 RepID=A0ABX1S3Z9_9PSEU|nr:LysR family transcriptional regulator [Pseudonocardia acidicola]NMH96293.1 LysR family transcriptional regulator [Pseudonocardia acidicola]